MTTQYQQNSYVKFIGFMVFAAAAFIGSRWLIAEYVKGGTISVLDSSGPVIQGSNLVDHRRVSSLPRAPLAVSDIGLGENVESGLDLRKDVVARTPDRYDGGVLADWLEGTEIDGALAADANDDLILSNRVKDFFDYFLDVPLGADKQLHLNEIRRLAYQYLPKKAAEQAMALLEGYQTIEREKMALLEQPLIKSDDPEQMLIQLEQTFDQLKQLRRVYLSDATANVFFGDEEAYLDYTIADMRIRQDERMPESQKSAERMALLNLLPVHIREQRLAQLDSNQKAQEIVDLMNSVSTEEDLEKGLDGLGITQNAQKDLLAYWREIQK